LVYLRIYFQNQQSWRIMEYLEENSEEGNETIHGLEIMFYKQSLQTLGLYTIIAPKVIKILTCKQRKRSLQSVNFYIKQ